jgi:hypothetical protein
MRIFFSAAALNPAAVFAYANYQGDLRTECTNGAPEIVDSLNA